MWGWGRGPWRWLRVPVAAVILHLATVIAPAQAHFLLDIDLRTIHVEPRPDGLHVFVRVPMPLLVADRAGPPDAAGVPAAAPFTANRIEDGQVMHYADPAAILADPRGLGELVAAGHHARVGDARIAARLVAVRAHPALVEPPFATLDQARAALLGPAWPEGRAPTYVGTTVVDARLHFPTEGLADHFALWSSLDPGLEGQDELINVVQVHDADGSTRIYRSHGLMADGIEVRRGWLAAIVTFTRYGVAHVLEGADHIMFALCLAIGARRFGQLAWRISGFTLGHTVTIVLGFFGVAPAGIWFIPAIETAIALTIIYAGIVAMLQRDTAATFAVTTTIGLLHGFGFSFMLHQVLRLDSPNLWTSLLAFNVGVELGHLMVILLAWPILRGIDRFLPRYALVGRGAVAVPCIAVALLWTAERLAMLLQYGIA